MRELSQGATVVWGRGAEKSGLGGDEMILLIQKQQVCQFFIWCMVSSIYRIHTAKSILCTASLFDRFWSTWLIKACPQRERGNPSVTPVDLSWEADWFQDAKQSFYERDAGQACVLRLLVMEPFSGPFWCDHHFVLFLQPCRICNLWLPCKEEGICHSIKHLVFLNSFMVSTKSHFNIDHSWPN